ncbi:YjhX family toxin [uncultured Maritalea sp.]|uniref:YjhX family toxin n=1 Tax=uncultured Maritalea sp. TaxID=757249 RepID=UPI0022AFBC45|nr:YjhX family toxin [Maritalea porphyrae]MCZ4272674.1 YjhX family toxin [Maritalea porphyrae]
MNISKFEQRVLHVLSQGGRINFVRNPNGKVASVECYTREGYVLSDCSLHVFQSLKKRGFIKSYGGKAYRISRKGRLSVRAQIDNR